MDCPLLELEKQPSDYTATNLLEVDQQDAFLILNKFQDNVIRSNVDETNVCRVCAKVFLSPEDLEKHRQSFHVKESYYCNLCSFKSSLISYFKEHINSHSEHNLSVISISKDALYIYEHRYKSFYCKLCEFKCNEQPAIIIHCNRSHLDIKHQQCGLCGKKFDNLITLNDHKCTHTGEKPNKCNKQALLRVHDKKVDKPSGCTKTSFIDPIIDNGNVTHYCNLCSFKSDMLNSCKDHMRSHSEQNLIITSISKGEPYVYQYQRFQCKLCEYKCLYQYTIVRHVKKSHLEIKKQQCDLCGEKFDNLTTLDDHKCTHTGEKPYKCTKQDSVSNDLNSTDLSEVIKQEEYLILNDPEIKVRKPRPRQNKLKTKETKKSGEITNNEAYYVIVRKMYRCSICPFGTKEFTKIKDHFKLHDIARVKRASYRLVGKEMCNKLKDYLYQFCNTFYQCKVCAFKSPEYELINQHVDNFHINVTSRCEVCNTFFESSTVLTLHNDDRITKQYKCLTCEYTSFEPLAKHMESHPNKCLECDLTSFKPLTEQMDDCKTDTIIYNCSLCSRKFSIMISWQKHNTKFHPNEKPRAIAIVKDAQYIYKHKKRSFQCKLCQFNCPKQSRMKPHVKRVHLKIKNYQCELCGKRFYNSTSLNRHMRFHTGEKPYKCTECDYTSSVSLSKHMKIHNEVKPFHCNVCEYKSPEPARLKLHMRTHTGEKPYKCLICDYAATHKVSLVNHMKKKHTN